MRNLIGAVVICLLAPAGSAFAQSNPLSDTTRMMYGVMKEQMLVASAEKMPEEAYSFKPAEAVRTYGQIIGHIADMQYTFCSVALGEKNPAPRVEQTTTSKAGLVAALKGAIAYCDRAYDGLTDVTALQLVKMGPSEMPRVGLLSTNMTHSALHYGNLVTYLRMNNIVPPSSEPGFGRPVKK
jgi:uncharacterized damage-inducible protein DinB